MASSAQSKNIELQKVNIRVFLGWILTITVPLLVYHFSAAALSQTASIFIGVVSMAVCMWVFDLAPAFVPALLILMVSILFDVAPKDVILSGFTSDAFFICLGIFIFAAQVASSGLIYRVALLLMRWLPESNLSQGLIIFASGSFLSTIIPSPLGRAALLNPLVFDLIEKTPKNKSKKAAATDIRTKAANVTPLIISALQGTTLLSTIFLTGNPLNLVMLGFFNAQTQYRFQWLYWLQATFIVGVILTVGYLGILLWQARKSNLKPMTNTQIDALLSQLGPIKNSEWGAMAGIIIFGAGILTQSYHHIEPVWLAFGIALVLYLYGALTAKDLRSNVDWPTLMFVAAIVSWGPIMSQLQLNTLISKQVIGLGLNTLMTQNLPLGIGFLVLIVILIRFAFPGGPTFVIVMTALIPLASSTGISPWVLGFIALTVSEGFLLPYQHGVYSLMVEELNNRGLGNAYNKRDILISNVLLMALRLVAIYLTILYWKAIAIL